MSLEDEEVVSKAVGAKLKALGEEQVYEDGDSFFHCKDDDDTYIYFLLTGRVELSCVYEDGRFLLLKTCEPGDFFGYEDALLGQNRTHDAVSVGRVSVLRLGAQDFLSVLQADQELFKIFLHSSTAFHRSLIIRHTNSICLPAKQLVARDILRRYLAHDKSDSFTVDYKAWSSYLGIRQETLSRSLSALKAEVLITSDRQSVTILDVEGLSDFAMQNFEFYS